MSHRQTLSCLLQPFPQDLAHFFCLRHFLASLVGPSSTHHSQASQRQTVYLLICRNNFEDKIKNGRRGKYVRGKSQRRGSRGRESLLLWQQRSKAFCCSVHPNSQISPTQGNLCKQSNSKLTSSMRLSRSDFTWFGLKRIKGQNGQFSHCLLTKLKF